MIQIIDINVGRFENLKSMIDIFGYKKQMSKNLEFMLLALEKSRQALPLCRPNPPVGCVIVHKQKVVSEGFTQPPGHHHAEIDAISKLLVPIDECEIYVTLEPCSFQGRTPSCALRLAELKPRHVYVAIEDPHPRNSGEGLRILKDAGVSFTLGIGKQEVENFLTPYLVMS